MPRAAPTACRHPGCAALIGRPGYCAAHVQDRYQSDNAQRARKRRQARGLSTSTSRWKALRRLVLTEQPLCVMCEQAGRVRLAIAVDHIDGNSGNNDRSNLQALCVPCHSRKTARFDGGFGNPKRNTSA